MGRPIIIETKEQAGMVQMVRLSRAQYLNADKSQVVEEGDPEAAFFLGAKGHLLSKEEAEGYGADFEDANIDPRDVGRTDYVVVDEPHHAPGQPVVEGSGRSTKPVEPGRATAESSTMKTQDEPSKAVTAEEAAAETAKQRRSAANKQASRAADKSAQPQEEKQQQPQQ